MPVSSHNLAATPPLEQYLGRQRRYRLEFSVVSDTKTRFGKTTKSQSSAGELNVLPSKRTRTDEMQYYVGMGAHHTSNIQSFQVHPTNASSSCKRTNCLQDINTQSHRHKYMSNRGSTTTDGPSSRRVILSPQMATHMHPARVATPGGRALASTACQPKMLTPHVGAKHAYVTWDDMNHVDCP